nr:hypothetical protein GCM10017547_42290 [Pseudarthrobacter oxydans]
MIQQVSMRGHRRKALITAAIGTSISAALAGTALPAIAAHTQLPSSVTLVGSLQDELGCAGEWQADCAATRLQSVPGTEGLYQATFDIPAGSYEVKTALNDSWTENYGADGVAGGANIVVQAPGGRVTFTYDHNTHRLSDDLPESLGGAAAGHWLTSDMIAWKGFDPAQATSFQLYTAENGGLTVSDGKILGGTGKELSLMPSGLDGALAGKYPHLAGSTVLRLPAEAAREARELLKGQLILAAHDAAGNAVATTGVQIPGVLDEVYASAAKRDLGLRWKGDRPELSLWAPTARNVTLHVYDNGSGGEPKASVTMKDGRDGVWSVLGDKGWEGDYYLFEVEVFVPETGKVEKNFVTDPYSVGLSTNSERSLLLNLADPALAPADWEKIAKPVVEKPEDLSIYELHVRDFSITDETVPSTDRGTYKAFTHQGSDGMRHLQEMTKSGINAVHLLPVNDIATIEERRELRQEPQCDLPALPRTAKNSRPA